MRRTGLTQREIRATIANLPKGTLSAWLKDVSLTKSQQRAIIKRASSLMDRGREKAGFVVQKLRMEREKKARQEARQEFKNLRKNSVFLMGLMLYWAEGSKTGCTFQFMNSDARLIKFMVDWLKGIYRIEPEIIKFRLFIHDVYADEKPEDYWVKILSVSKKKFLKTVYKTSPHAIKRNPGYKGCMRVQVGGAHLLRKILYSCDLLSKEYDLRH